jgi:hypothetical protein
MLVCEVAMPDFFRGRTPLTDRTDRQLPREVRLPADEIRLDDEKRSRTTS